MSLFHIFRFLMFLVLIHFFQGIVMVSSSVNSGSISFWQAGLTILVMGLLCIYRAWRVDYVTKLVKK